MKFKPPKLNDRNGDLNERWYVYYCFEHPETGKLVPFKVYISGKLSTKIKRYQKAKEIIAKLTNDLNSGWSPYSNSHIKYILINNALVNAFNLRKNFFRPRSITTYRSVLKVFNEFLNNSNLEKTRVLDFNSYHAREFTDWLMIRSKISSRTYNNYITHLRTLFNILLEREIKPPQQNKEPQF